ncbi:MAG: polymer-forming cytoskeletal protein [Myxococcota bacterium]
MSQPLLGRGLEIRGRVRGESDLRVEGTVAGDVEVTGALDLGAEGSVSGGIRAASATIAGRLEGDVDAEGPVVVTASGVLVGDVRASEVSLEEGGVLRGRIEADVELPEALR